MCIAPALGRQRQADLCEFKVSLVYRVRSGLKKKKNYIKIKTQKSEVKPGGTAVSLGQERGERRACEWRPGSGQGAGHSGRLSRELSVWLGWLQR